MLALVTADATWAMPPLMNWFRGGDAIAGFLAAAPFQVDWRHCAAMANGQLAVGCYAWSQSVGAHVAYALDVLTIRGAQITAIVSFIDGSLLPVHGLPPSIHR